MRLASLFAVLAVATAAAATRSQPTIYLANDADATIRLASLEMRRYLLVAKVLVFDPPPFRTFSLAFFELYTCRKPLNPANSHCRLF